MRTSRTGLATILLLALSLALATSARAQAPCDCEQSLSRLVEKIENEYPGFREKTENAIVYEDFKDRLLVRSGNTRDADCLALLQHYLSFFRDDHVSLSRVGASSAPATDAEPVATVAIDSPDFQERISGSGNGLEGVWSSTYYTVGIIRDGDEYQGVVMESSNAGWQPGQIKFRLQNDGGADYHMGDHSLLEGTFSVHEESILVIEPVRAVFIKEAPEPRLSAGEIEARLDRIEGFYFAALTARTSILCVSSFDDPYVERIEQMLLDNRQAMESCENLIIDVRNNPGGTYDAYEEILAYVLTQQTRGVGQEFLVTQTLIDGVESWFDDEAGREMARRWLEMFDGHMGEFVNPDASGVSVSDIPLAAHSPEQIVVLVNGGTASSGEAFVLAAKQSKKVKVLGVPTYGVVDYGSASVFEFGCPSYRLMMPTWRSMRRPEYPLDNIGVQPDVYLDESVDDWVAFAIDYLEADGS